MLKKTLLIVFAAAMVFCSVIFAAQRTAVLVTIKEHGYSADSSIYYIKTVEPLGGNCGNQVSWSTATYNGKSAVCEVGFYLNRGTTIRITYSDSAQLQENIKILDPIQ
ncbi:MAG: hypothetical protein PHC61_11810 [Chitinivibrionales bacterium]|nr:hypothetical protein [Chitinivibrionales bacterium]